MTINFPSNIQAIRIPTIGGPEVIQKDEVPFPEVLPEHLVIKVRFVGVRNIEHCSLTLRE
jgi:NADPH2:quinone reductase